MTGALSQAAELIEQGRLAEAAALYRAALEDAPDDLDLIKSLARVLEQDRQFGEAFPVWERGRQLDPADWECLYALGAARLRQGYVRKAQGLFAQQQQSHPNFYPAHAMHLLAMLYDADISDADLAAAQRRWANFETPAPADVFQTHDVDADQDRPLRIGVLSSDLRSHSVGFNVLPIYHAIDRNRFELFSYMGKRVTDPATDMFKAHSDAWRETDGLTHREISKIIHADKIDILVALAGHVDGNQAHVLRYRPAPVQISHHDLCTSAMPEVDYWLGDPIVTPRGGPELFTERLVRLPSFTVHLFPAEAPAVSPLPAKESGHITFCSFNAPQKITAETVAVWAQVLDAVPGSVLLLRYFDAYDEPQTVERLMQLFKAHGVGTDRLLFKGGQSARGHHLAHYHQADIALDPFPFGGATTTFDALMMGVPVVTLLGQRFVGRCSAATLKATGLDVCVAATTDDYVARAVELSRDLDRLSNLRGALRRMLEGSRVCQVGPYVRNLERVYRAVWRRYCASA